MTIFVAKLIWGLGCVAYFIIRYPHQRRARKTNVTDRRDLVRERTLMLMSYSGLFVVPLIYVLTDQPKFASYRFSPIQASLGALVLIAAMALLPNWIAGLSGIVGFGTLFFARVGHEERMMLETFGDEYRAYMARTYRLIPGIY